MIPGDPGAVEKTDDSTGTVSVKREENIRSCRILGKTRKKEAGAAGLSGKKGEGIFPVTTAGVPVFRTEGSIPGALKGKEPRAILAAAIPKTAAVSGTMNVAMEMGTAAVSGTMNVAMEMGTAAVSGTMNVAMEMGTAAVSGTMNVAMGMGTAAVSPIIRIGVFRNVPAATGAVPMRIGGVRTAVVSNETVSGKIVSAGAALTGMPAVIPKDRPGGCRMRITWSGTRRTNRRRAKASSG